jgi:hypothetical protein
MPPPVLTTTPPSVRRRYDLYRISPTKNDWNPKSLRVEFNLPNTYPEYSELSVVYYCDRLVWWDELKDLENAALAIRRPELGALRKRVAAAKAALARDKAARARASIDGHWFYGH